MFRANLDHKGTGGILPVKGTSKRQGGRSHLLGCRTSPQGLQVRTQNELQNANLWSKSKSKALCKKTDTKTTFAMYRRGKGK